MSYREMQATPPVKPPRREWALARMLRDDDGEVDGFKVWALFAPSAALAGLLLFAASCEVVPVSRDDTPPPPAANVRCIRSHGVWHSGEIDGKRAEWCSWGQR
jgi:hypothetical protein